MTPQDQTIFFLALQLRHEDEDPEAADAVLELQARAKAAEKERDEFRRALDKGLPPTIEAQSEINHWRARAEAAEKRMEVLEETLRKVRSWLAEEETAHAIELAFIDTALEAKL